MNGHTLGFYSEGSTEVKPPVQHDTNAYWLPDEGHTLRYFPQT